ncbi:neuronal acetylcholine receptor subunit beta-3-like isoform X2 [Dermacentor silvarum]|uniref:neuronal acetylcholine receptor subunit beta-3-like isoform X2 n=1 Tax=Dermacentor silvarum TaxID=543639 RepID=UPI0021014B0A|nr:neuronal acetylcholine receptor subunit beta-3-like isoform X2 [Dermacentor silvarum]
MQARTMAPLGRRTGSSLLALCVLWQSANRVACSDGRSNNEFWRLRNDLLGKGYDPGTRPAAHANDTTQVLISVDIIDGPYLYPDRELFNADIGLCMAWKDHRLKWNATEYGGQKLIRLKTDDVWRPELYMISTWSDVYSSLITSYMLWASEVGKVRMCSAMSVQTFCKADMTHFPMDRHECVVEYSSILNPEKDVNLTIERTSAEGKTDSEFQLVSVTSKTEITDYEEYGRYSSVVYHFVLERRNLVQHFTLLIPTVGVVVLSLLTLWLPPLSDRRFTVSGVAFLVSLLLLYRADDAAAGSNQVPKITIVLSTNVLINALTIVATVANMNLVRFLPKVRTVPPVVGKVAGFIAIGVPLVCPGPKASSESTAGAVDDIASAVTRALDRVLFVACLVTFTAIIVV